MTQLTEITYVYTTGFVKFIPSFIPDRQMPEEQTTYHPLADFYKWLYERARAGCPHARRFLAR